MKFRDKLSMCLGNLYKRKVRTLLTTIGVVVGTCAIVITVSLGIGMQMATDQALASMGDLTLITVYGYGISSDQTQLDENFFQTVKENEHVVAAMPSISPEWGSMKITGGNNGRYVYESTINGVFMEEIHKYQKEVILYHQMERMNLLFFINTIDLKNIKNIFSDSVPSAGI